MQKSDVPEYLAFLKILERGNFRQAADHLGVTPSAISQTLHKLEQRLGVHLIDRSTRSVRPTDVGLEFARKLEEYVRGIDRAAQDASRAAGKASGVLRLTVSAVAAELVIAPHIGEFCQQNPELRVAISVSDRLVDIVEEGFDAGIRRGDMVQGGMSAERLSPDIQMLTVAAPGYMNGRPVPGVPKDLKRHECIRVSSIGRAAIPPWRFADKNCKVDLKVRGNIVTDATSIALAAALSGVGVAYLASDYLRPHLASGDLVPLLSNCAISRPGFHVYHSPHSYVPAGVHLLASFLRSKVGCHPATG